MTKAQYTMEALFGADDSAPKPQPGPPVMQVQASTAPQAPFQAPAPQVPQTPPAQPVFQAPQAPQAPQVPQAQPMFQAPAAPVPQPPPAPQVPQAQAPMVEVLPPSPPAQPMFQAPPAQAPAPVPVQAPSPFQVPQVQAQPVFQAPQAPAPSPFQAPQVQAPSQPRLPVVAGEACQEVTFGDTVSRFPIEKFKAAEGVTIRATIPFLKVLVTKTHYNDEDRFFFCFGGECCEGGGLPNVRYNLPLFVYNTAKDGRIVGPEIDTRFLHVDGEKYALLTEIHKACLQTPGLGGLDAVDLVITCSDEKYQKINFIQSGPSAWKRYPNEFNAQALVKHLTEVWPYVPMVIGVKLTREEFLARRKGAQAGQNGVQGATGSVDLGSFIRGAGGNNS